MVGVAESGGRWWGGGGGVSEGGEGGGEGRVWGGVEENKSEI